MPSRDSEVFSVDAKKGDNDMFLDFRAGTIFEQNQLRGHDRTSMPVGQAADVPARWDGTGGRNTADLKAARELGIQDCK